MKRKYYVSDIIDFFANSEEECSSNIDSNEEGEIILFPPIERWFR